MGYSERTPVLNQQILQMCLCGRSFSLTHTFVRHWVPDLSAPALPSDSHPDRPSCQQKLDSAPGTEMQQRDQVSDGPFTEIYTKRNFCAVGLYSWVAEERERQEYLVTRTNAWECNKNENCICLLVANGQQSRWAINNALASFATVSSTLFRLLWTTVGGNLIYTTGPHLGKLCKCDSFHNV